MISEKALIRSLIGERRFVHCSRLRRSLAQAETAKAFMFKYFWGGNLYITTLRIVGAHGVG